MLCPEWMVRLPVTRSRAADSSVKLQVLATEMRRVSPPTYSMPPPVIFWKCPPELQMILICRSIMPGVRHYESSTTVQVKAGATSQHRTWLSLRGLELHDLTGLGACIGVSAMDASNLGPNFTGQSSYQKSRLQMIPLCQAQHCCCNKYEFQHPSHNC